MSSRLIGTLCPVFRNDSIEQPNDISGAPDRIETHQDVTRECACRDRMDTVERDESGFEVSFQRF
jgi:hypothetical protein